ncbi:MAG: DUF11 domain-containing protein, partial [Ruminococcus sp.]|nr:DUF11 domain-containing protein [Ruminococcus sp.]
MKTKTLVLEEKSFKVRFISMLLAVMVMFMCIPSIDVITVDAAGRRDNPLVLTNASVVFRDSSYNEIDSIESGTLFYLMATVSGNNVHQTGVADTYRIYITDSNLLLVNFANNGFTDGATYNGYTLHIEYDDDDNIVNRYVEFTISNGETKAIRLQAKFANGTTPDGDTCNVSLVQVSTNKSVSNSITATADTSWSSSKTVNMSSVEGKNISTSDGVTLDYTLTASSNNSKLTKGAWWIESLQFEDVITLPTGMTFENFEDAITIDGVSDYTITKVSDTQVKITWTVDSSNNSAEMSSQSFTAHLILNSSTVKISDDFAGGTIDNALSIDGKRCNEDTYGYELPDASASTIVTVPTDADFNISKVVKDYQAYYVKGDTVEYTISATNIGGKSGDITLTEVIPDGLTDVKITSTDGTVDGNDIIFKSVGAGTTVTATVTATVSADTDTTITNTVTSGDKSASAYITVKSDNPDFEVTKTGSVDYSSTYLVGKDNQTASYTITISNTGTQDLTGVAIEDVIPSDVTNVTISPAVSGVSINGNTLTGTVDIPVGESVTISYSGTISTTASSDITNAVTVTYDGTPKTSEVTFTPTQPSPSLSIVKSATDENGNAITSFTKGGQDVVYVIKVTNNGTAKAESVKISDVAPTGVTFNTISVTSDKNSSIQDTNLDGSYDIAEGETITVTINATINSSSSVTNTASYTSDNAGSSQTSCTLGVDTSGDYKVDKIIVDENGETLVDTNGNVSSDFDGFEEGDTIYYKVTFTNVSGETIKDLYFYDSAGYQSIYNGGNYITMKVTSSDGSINTTIGLDSDNSASRTYNNNTSSYDWSSFDGYVIKPSGSSTDSNLTESAIFPLWYYIFSDINLEDGVTLTLEYSTTLSFGSIYFNSSLTNNLISFTPNPSEFGSKGIYDDSVSVPLSTSFTVNKTATTGSVSIADVDADDEYEYTITLGHGNNTTSYSGNTFTITDELPDGMTYVADSISVTNGYDFTASQNGNILTIKFISSAALTWDDIVITYKTKLTDEKVNEILSSSETSIKLTNTVTNVTVTKDGTVVKNKDTDKSADVTFKNVLPAPGFAKKAVQSFAGDTYYEELLNPVNDGYITAGDNLIWQLVVYNGDGTADEDETATLKGYSVTDVLPSSYEYDASTGYTATWYICNLDKDGNYYTSISADGTYTFNVADGKQGTLSGSATTWDFSSDTYALAPNQCLVIQFCTTAVKEVEGVITNTGYATFGKSYPQEIVVAGESSDNSIWNYANYNIVGLTTESWKTIEYVNQGHNGNPHTDPADDTGDSREPTNNTVQGMQGEDVIYTLNVTNTSPLELENFVIIDRLPYVGDKGLVSGYERDSKFGVSFNEIKSVTVNGAEVPYTITFSTDKDAVLDEYSKDWVGENDDMSWSTDSTNAVNFRIVIDSSVTIPVDATVQVTFYGTVPNYVENTGKGNIAWNSFAYAYQNTGLLGSTVMVAEPAKVGVWVETPETAIDITINKEIKNSNGGTFYFALFGDKDGTNRISDIVTIELASSETTGTVTMEDIDLASIQQLLGLNQADNIYLYETNSKGEKIDSTNSAYSIEYTGNEISTGATENQTVTVTNTKEVGSIKVTKTFISTAKTTDTFYFALFTKNDNNEYVRYEDIAVQSLTITGSESGTSDILTFEDVPTGVTFYVLETNEKGVLVDSDTALYTGSILGNQYTVENSTINGITVDANKTTDATITNTEKTNYSITVNKIVISDQIDTQPTFYVGLFDSETSTKAIEVKTVSSSESATFEYLDKDTTYYIYECDADGTIKYKD